MTPRAWRRLHLAALLVAALLLPAASWIEGSRQLSWTMFSLTGSYRLELSAIDRDGARRPIAPTELAALTEGPARAYLAGADHWRYHDSARFMLSRHLSEVAALGCRAAAAQRTPAPSAVEIRLDERADLDAPVRTRTTRVDCGPGG